MLTGGSKMKMHKFWEYPSTYIIFILWGMGGFGYQPGFATFVLHFIMMPALYLLGQYIAHWEGRKQEREEAHVASDRRSASN
jgi:hypothetical protein